ncbi:MAG TPA: TetR/AcrR family transcriptional regulator [Candidatus Ozemobacteraceae bacterium]
MTLGRSSGKGGPVRGRSGDKWCRKPESRREEILAAARKLFAEKGFQRTTTREIALEAGASEGTIFNYFATKDDILLGLVQTYLIGTFPREVMIPADANDFEILETIIANRLRHLEAYGDFISILVSEALFRPEFGRQIGEKMMSSVFSVLAGFIERRIRSGEFVNTDPDILMRALIGQIIGSGFIWRFVFHDKRQPAAKTLAPILARLFLEGVRKVSAAGGSKGVSK